MAIRTDIGQLIDATPFVDTHEHLLEESTRLNAGREPTPQWKSLRMQRDFSVLFSQYAPSDLTVAGAPNDLSAKLSDWNISPRDKWKLLAPWYERCRNTGYMLNARLSMRMLYGEDDISDANCEAISAKVADLIKPGYYRHVLRDVSNIEHAQVNSSESSPMHITAQPDLLCQDISFVGFCQDVTPQHARRVAQMEAATLADWHGFIDWCFATYGPRAIAAKSQVAYSRKLDFVDVPAGEVESLAASKLRDAKSLTAEQDRALEDHLFHYCLRRATDYRLPVKLHTGFYAGPNAIPLHRVRDNAGDMCELLMKHPHTRFVVMHNIYPYQDEAITIAKSFTNAWIDMCWAWIINPAAGVRFVKEFVMAAPACKLLTFGGDYMPVELVPGHAAIARRGLTQAICELIEERWLDEADAPALIERLMRGNAHELFDYEGTLKAWG